MMDVEMAVSPTNYRRWLLLILLTAVFLRLYAIAAVPPGLTHDEADHGITAWQIVDGMRGVYFTIGYGREPLFDYATAGLMALIGPTYLAGRVTAVYFSLIMIAAMAAWVRRAFDAPTALLTAAELAVGFWPVMAGRQMLRSITLPALFVLALLFWWRGTEGLMIKDLRLKSNHQSSIINLLVAGLFLGLTFYTYIPSRIMWAVFPVLLGYAVWRQRPFLRKSWWGVGVLLVVAGLVGWPLFSYLATSGGGGAD
ncbi:MAG: glycosyltransferase family 39 protein [Ardenticatenaceae bacterium]|nr:glycosyltransferase family 39 protein [Ardenticatenaceae bacterium]